MTCLEITEEDMELIRLALKKLSDNFDDGIYHHTVASGLRCKNGNVYTGINCDGIHGSCAEYITVGFAISSGDRAFDTIVAVHEKALNQVVAPCGNCRQMLIDYSPDINVIVNDEKGKLVKVSIKDLLPLAWHPIIVDK